MLDEEKQNKKSLLIHSIERNSHRTSSFSNKRQRSIAIKLPVRPQPALENQKRVDF